MPVHSRGWSGTAMAAAQCRVQARDVLRRTAMDTKAKRYLRRIKYGEMEHQSIRYGAVFVMDMYSMRRSCESRCFVRQALASRVPGRHHRFAASAGHLGDPTGGRLTNSRASRQPHWRKPCSPPQRSHGSRVTRLSVRLRAASDRRRLIWRLVRDTPIASEDTRQSTRTGERAGEANKPCRHLNHLLAAFAVSANPATPIQVLRRE